MKAEMEYYRIQELCIGHSFVSVQDNNGVKEVYYDQLIQSSLAYLQCGCTIKKNRKRKRENLCEKSHYSYHSVTLPYALSTFMCRVKVKCVLSSSTKLLHLPQFPPTGVFIPVQLFLPCTTSDQIALFSPCMPLALQYILQSFPTHSFYHSILPLHASPIPTSLLPTQLNLHQLY